MIAQPKKSNRNIWLIVGGIGALVIFSLCAVVVVAGYFLISTRTESSEPSSLRAPIVQQLETPDRKSVV